MDDGAMSPGGGDGALRASDSEDANDAESTTADANLAAVKGQLRKSQQKRKKEEARKAGGARRGDS